MLPRLLAAAVLALSALAARAQYVDPNLQNLLAGLMRVGGTLTTVNGVYQLPGLLPR